MSTAVPFPERWNRRFVVEVKAPVTRKSRISASSHVVEKTIIVLVKSVTLMATSRVVLPDGNVVVPLVVARNWASSYAPAGFVGVDPGVLVWS